MASLVAVGSSRRAGRLVSASKTAAARRWCSASPPRSPWAVAAGAADGKVAVRRSAPLLPEAQKLLGRARSLLEEEHLRKEDFEVAEHSAVTATTIGDDGNIEIDDEKLMTLRKIVHTGMQRKVHSANAIQGQDSGKALDDVMAGPEAKFHSNPSPPTCIVS